ncbi:hypothetical protein F2S88_24790 [Pseudomonas syringae pv. actinidiae]|nr:hypothetical protein [Pseudomonas syringae pv. actinidiae]
MTSVRARILVPVLLLLLLGNLAISLLALRDSHHEIEEVYDAQLAQSARLAARRNKPASGRRTGPGQALSGVRSGHEPVGTSGVAHPYETRLTFQVWRTSGELLVRSAEAPCSALRPQQKAHMT